MLDVGTLAFDPGRPALALPRFGVRELAHNAKHVAPEDGLDFRSELGPGIFDHVVQERRNELVFIPSSNKYPGRHGHRVGDVRDVRAFAALRRVRRAQKPSSYGKRSSVACIRPYVLWVDECIRRPGSAFIFPD